MNPIAYTPGIDRAHPPVILFAFERACARAEVAMERWRPSQTVTKQEQFILKRLEKKRELFGFLRKHRHEVFDDEFQAELEVMYRGTGAGKEPVPPALLAMAPVLQGYLGMSDSDAVEATVLDLRWQLVLDCLGDGSRRHAPGPGAGCRSGEVAEGASGIGTATAAPANPDDMSGFKFALPPPESAEAPTAASDRDPPEQLRGADRTLGANRIPACLLLHEGTAVHGRPLRRARFGAPVRK